MPVSDKWALEVPISLHYNQRTLNYCFRLDSSLSERQRGQRSASQMAHFSHPHLWFRLSFSPHLQVTSLLSQPVTLNIRQRPETFRDKLHPDRTSTATSSSLGLLAHGQCDQLHLDTLPSWTWPLIRFAEHSGIIITNNRTIIIVIIILLVLLLVPSYNFHLIIMLLMIWSLFR